MLKFGLFFNRDELGLAWLIHEPSFNEQNTVRARTVSNQFVALILRQLN